MTQEEKAIEISVVIATAAEVYGKPLSETALKAWSEILCDFDPDAIKSAFREHLATNKFFPSPAEIIARIVEPELAEAVPSFETCIAELNRWLGYPPSTPLDANSLTIFACDPIGGPQGWRNGTVPDKNYDPTGHSIKLRDMRKAYDEAVNRVRKDALATTAPDLRAQLLAGVRATVIGRKSRPNLTSGVKSAKPLKSRDEEVQLLPAGTKLPWDRD